MKSTNWDKSSTYTLLVTPSPAASQSSPTPWRTWHCCWQRLPPPVAAGTAQRRGDVPQVCCLHNYYTCRSPGQPAVVVVAGDDAVAAAV